MAHFPSGFDYIRQMDAYFQPRTPATALKALRHDLVPPEGFVYLLNNVKPLLEEPYDLQEIDRILAKKEIDLTTALLLMEIFEKLIRSPDSETALFAAESVNALENRYNKKIFDLRKILGKNETGAEGPDAKTIRTLAKNYFELGMLNQARPVLKEFYLKEALNLLDQNWKNIKPELNDTLLVLRIFQEFGWVSRARRVIRANWKRGNRDIPLQYAWAEVEFQSGRVSKLLKILHRLAKASPEKKFKTLFEFWLGQDLKGARDE